MLKKMIPFSLIVCLALPSCMPESKTGKGGVYGAAGGAATGAILGQAIGHSTKATLWGTAIGAALGGAAGAGVGKYMDNQEQEMRQALAASDAAAVEREGNLLSVMFKGDVTFDHNSFVVRPGLYSEIDRVAKVLNQYPQTLIRVEGHTDSTGSEEYNLNLSRKRAEAVRDLLVQRNVAASRMEVVGYGEAYPVATNETEAGRQMNRRVELKIAPTQQAGTSPSGY